MGTKSIVSKKNSIILAVIVTFLAPIWFTTPVLREGTLCYDSLSSGYCEQVEQSKEENWDKQQLCENETFLLESFKDCFFRIEDGYFLGQSRVSFTLKVSRFIKPSYKVLDHQFLIQEHNSNCLKYQNSQIEL